MFGSKLFTLCLTLLMLGAVGCGKGKLTDEQKKEFLTTLGESTRNFSASSAVAIAKSARAAKVSQYEQSAADATPATGVERDRDAQFKQELGEAECEATASGLEKAQSDNGSFKGKISFALSGKECPMSFDLTMDNDWTASQEQVKGRTDLTLKYSITKDSELYDLTDLVGADLKGSFSADITKDGGSAEGEITGSLESKKQGSLEIAIRGEASGKIKAGGREQDLDEGSGEFSVEVTYPDYVAELRVTVEAKDGKKDIKYFINGEEVTKEELEKYIGNMEIKTSQTTSTETESQPMPEDMPMPAKMMLMVPSVFLK